jgi:DNA (cytosine-5)-methyltransferase 1
MLTCIDLFAGAGGLSLGLSQAGIRPVAAVEIDRDACATYRETHPGVRLIEGDSRTVDYTEFEGVDIVAGGPPCQPFSTGGLRKGRSDGRDLLPEFVRAVVEAKSRVFLLENVPGLASGTHAAYLAEVLEPLRDLYRISGPLLINATDYGVPQKRRRVVIVGTREGEFRLPSPRTRISAGEVLTPKPVGEPNNSLVVYAKTPDLRPNPYDGQLFNGGGRGVDLDGPAPTILASAGGNKTPFLDVGRHVPPYHRHLMRGGKPRVGTLPDARRLTVEECAALQGFPRGMAFQGSRSSQYTQVGNAVPPPLALAMGEAIADLIQRQS